MPYLSLQQSPTGKTHIIGFRKKHKKVAAEPKTVSIAAFIDVSASKLA